MFNLFLFWIDPLQYLYTRRMLLFSFLYGSNVVIDYSIIISLKNSCSFTASRQKLVFLNYKHIFPCHEIPQSSLLDVYETFLGRFFAKVNSLFSHFFYS